MRNINKHTNEFEYVTELISASQQKAYAGVNAELVKLYWNIGAFISEKIDTGSWGDGIVSQLSEDIKSKFPNLKGFTKRGLYRMKQFYTTYYGIEKVSTLLTQTSWSNNLTILSKCKRLEEKQFYLLLCVKEKWSQRELNRQIESSVFERTILSDETVSDAIESHVNSNKNRGNANVSPLLTQFDERAKLVFKDTYVFEFLDLPENYQEKDLQKQLLANLKKFLMELGSGFTFVGEEYRVQVGMHDYYIDLLLYHRELQCLVAVELKTVEFAPEHMGKINFYLEALDREVKLPNENPSIGILICKGKDDEVVEISLSRNISPTVVSDYMTKLIDKELFQQKVKELYLEYGNSKGNSSEHEL